MATRKRPEKLGPQTRALAIRGVVVDKDARTATLSFSSEEPIPMWYGTEILSHAKGAMRMGVRQESMPLLFNHDRDDLLGLVESVAIKGKRGTADVRFGRDERGDWAMDQVADGILTSTSFLYRVFKHEVDEEEDTVTAIDWEPFEISLVTIPADPSVGVGRAAPDTENDVIVVSKRAISPPPGEIPMTPEEIAAAAAAKARAADPSQGPSVDVDAIKRAAKREATQEAVESERKRQTEIGALAQRFNLGSDFVERHRSAGSTVDEVRASAMDEIEKQQRDGAGIQARESERVQEIEALGKRHNMPADQIKKLITDKVSIELARGVALEHIAARSGPASPVSDANGIDWTAKESRRYSVRAAILAAATGDWKTAGFEREVSQTLEKSRKLNARSASSFFMPTNMPFQVDGAPRSNMMDGMSQRATYQVGTPSQGGNLVQTDLRQEDFIEVLRNQTVIGQLGARFLPGLTDNVDLPRQITQTATYWVGESTALTESEATFDKVSLRPKTVGALSKMSRLTLLQVSPAIEQLTREDLLAVSARAVDAAGLYGTGTSSQPTGITNTSGIGSVVGGTNGANATFDMMVQLYAAPLIANAPQANLAFAINAKLKGYLATLKSSTGQYLWNPMGSIAGSIQNQIVGYNYAVSNQLPYNLTKGTATAICSMAIFGNWQELLIGEWGTTEIMVNPFDSTGFANGDVVVRVFQTVDVGLRHPASFAAITDLLTPGF